MRTVGILGGGQLGAMLAESLQSLGADVHVYDPDPAAPALRRAARAVSAPWTDVERLDAFFAPCDAVTYEFENVETAGLRGLSALHLGDRLRPSLSVLETTQDRAREKAFLSAHGFPHVDFRAGGEPGDVPAAARDLGFPCILKTARGGYDGKGQWRLGAPGDLARVLEEADAARALARGWVLEEPVEIVLEASCIVARDGAGEEIAFPVFENAHADHVLDTTLVPARIPPAVAALLRETARDAADRLGLVGLLTTEFFVGRSARGSGREADGLRVFVNEFAPRPHNSGHVTRKACSFSQFDALARVLVGAPLAEPRLVAEDAAFAMVNLLGDVWLAQRRGDLDLSAWRAFPDVLEVVPYGKTGAAPRRKMGHATVRGATPEAALARARAFRDALRG